ncbi:MAG: hypothetical protein ABJO01_10345 [Parasphingorhabdus sp.]|uniref:hypothetical protein n=1 Tax=Parasphingorhabdus sp. TaxID=2709688 RepID=UPI003296A218
MTINKVSEACWAKPRGHRNVADELAHHISLVVGRHYEVILCRERPWASITFIGSRCRFAISPRPPNQKPLSAICAAKLHSHDYKLSCHFVADLTIEWPKTMHPFAVGEFLVIKD